MVSGAEVGLSLVVGSFVRLRDGPNILLCANYTFGQGGGGKDSLRTILLNQALYSRVLLKHSPLKITMQK